MIWNFNKNPYIYYYIDKAIIILYFRFAVSFFLIPMDLFLRGGGKSIIILSYNSFKTKVRSV